MAQPKSDWDSPWKQILDLYFEDFVACCWPEHYPEIDWAKGYKLLDKELTKIVRNASVGNRIVDKLIEVYLRNGDEAYIIVHLEVQGNLDPKFEERMFTYRYRLRDLHNKPIASLAVLIDTDEHWRPGLYREALWGSSIEMRFPIIKLLDYRRRIPELEASANRFAPVILAQLAAQEKPSSDVTAHIKLHLTRNLFKRGLDREDVRNLWTFIDWVLALPLEFEVIYREQVQRIEEEFKMNYITSFERAGIEKGVQLGEGRVLMHLLEHKFKELPENYREKINSADQETLLTWAGRLLECQSIDEVFKA